MKSYNPYLAQVKKAKAGKFVPIVDVQVDQAHYDVNAPKFIYRRNYGSKTRKTLRTTKDTEPTLFGQVSPAPSKTKGGKKYPHTKPMLGWDRIFVGRGRVVKRGRHKQSKNLSNPLIRPSKKGLKTSKPKFVKWSTTYGEEAVGFKIPK